MFSPQQNWRRGQNRFCLEVRGEGEGGGRQGGEMAQAMYTHMNKHINNFKNYLNPPQKNKIK
jgi:hypothetical protein